MPANKPVLVTGASGFITISNCSSSVAGEGTVAGVLEAGGGSKSINFKGLKNYET